METELVAAAFDEGDESIRAPPAHGQEVRVSRSCLSMGPTCRICFRGCVEEPLSEPCNCRGSIGLVHASCLQKWVSQRRKPCCDICGFAYQVEQRSKSYLELLQDRDARSKPLGYLLRAVGLTFCVLFLLPLSCAFVASLRYSLFSVTLYVFSVGHSMFWFRRPVIYFIEFLKTTVEWKRNSSYLKLILPAPSVHATLVAPKKRSRCGLVCGVLFTLNLTLTLPLAWLGALELRGSIPGLILFYLGTFLCVQTLVWTALPITCFWVFFRKKRDPKISQDTSEI